MKNYVETKEDLIKIGENCSGYKYSEDNITSSLSPSNGEKSCANCGYLYKSKCQVDLMGKVWNQIK